MFPKAIFNSNLFVFTCLFNSGSSGCNNTGTELVSHDDYDFHKNFGA